MEDPFFMNPWSPTRRAYFAHPPPPKPRPSPPQNPKVVSIPVHFVGSGDTNNSKKPAAGRPTEVDRSAAAVRIQKAARGFLVRKNVRTVRKVAAEADEIARRIAAADEAVRRDARERLRFGEMLMALLLRLDTVRGVRGYRKKVIRRVIQLQEAVDSIAVDRVLAAPESSVMTQETKIDPSEDVETLGQAIETQEVAGEAEESFTADPMEETPDSAPQESSAMAETQETKANNEDSTEEAPESKDVVAESAIEVLVDGEAPGTPELSPFASREVEESMIGKGEEGDETQGVVSPGGEAAAEKQGMKEVIEKWGAESERLRGLVAELCDRSAEQCRVMGGLLQRVEQLERTVQRMKPKKKRQASRKKH